MTSIILVVLKSIGWLHSPTSLSLETLLTVGILIELGRIETKMSLLWNDFKKRKINNNPTEKQLPSNP